MLTELQRGSIEPGSGGGWVVSFRLPGEPTQQAVAEFSDRSEAEQAYDLLLLRAVADVTPAAPLQLHQPLEVSRGAWRAKCGAARLPPLRRPCSRRRHVAFPPTPPARRIRTCSTSCSGRHGSRCWRTSAKLPATRLLSGQLAAARCRQRQRRRRRSSGQSSGRNRRRPRCRHRSSNGLHQRSRSRDPGQRRGRGGQRRGLYRRPGRASSSARSTAS